MPLIYEGSKTTKKVSFKNHPNLFKITCSVWMLKRAPSEFSLLLIIVAVHVKSFRTRESVSFYRFTLKNFSHYLVIIFSFFSLHQQSLKTLKPMKSKRKSQFQLVQNVSEGIHSESLFLPSFMMLRETNKTFTMG